MPAPRCAISSWPSTRTGPAVVRLAAVAALATAALGLEADHVAALVLFASRLAALVAAGDEAAAALDHAASGQRQLRCGGRFKCLADDQPRELARTLGI